ncbi:bestrophin-like domain [Acidisoma sp. 7E03]
MNLVTALAIVVVCGLIAAVASVLVHRTVHIELRRRHNEIGTAVFLQLGVIFAVLLAFVFSEVWSEYNDAASAVELEAKSLVGAAILASVLPKDESAPILDAERAYIQGVVHREWPEMAMGRDEEGSVSVKLSHLIQTTARLRPNNAADLGTRTQLLSFLEQAQMQRSSRLFQLSSGVPTLLWCLLIGFGAVLAVFVTLAGVENGGALMSFSVTFAAAVAAILVLIHLLDYPFEGALALSPQPFLVAADQIDHLDSPGS